MIVGSVVVVSVGVAAGVAAATAAYGRSRGTETPEVRGGGDYAVDFTVWLLLLLLLLLLQLVLLKSSFVMLIDVFSG